MASMFESKDSGGYTTVVVDLNVPGRLPYEPYEIRVHALEVGIEQWDISIIHGWRTGHTPDDPNRSGSLYLRIDSLIPFAGSMDHVKMELIRLVHEQWRALRAARTDPNRDINGGITP